MSVKIVCCRVICLADLVKSVFMVICNLNLLPVVASCCRFPSGFEQYKLNRYDLSSS